MLTHYKNAVKQIGLTQDDADAVLSHIVSEYRRLDGREEQGVDWVDIISEILDEIASKKTKKMKKYLMVAVSGCQEIKKWVEGSTIKEARKNFWLSLSEGERNSAESVECIEEN